MATRQAKPKVADAAGEKTLATIEGDRDPVLVRVMPNGKVDIRFWWTNDDGDLAPGKGLRVSPTVAGKIATALAKVKA